MTRLEILSTAGGRLRPRPPPGRQSRGAVRQGSGSGWDEKTSDDGITSPLTILSRSTRPRILSQGGPPTGRTPPAGRRMPRRSRRSGGRPRGSRNKAGSARQEREERPRRRSAYISGLKNANSDIFWLGEFSTLRGGAWEQQSPEFREEDREAHRGSKGHGYSTYRPLHVRLPGHPPASCRRSWTPGCWKTGCSTFTWIPDG